MTDDFDENAELDHLIKRMGRDGMRKLVNRHMEDAVELSGIYDEDVSQTTGLIARSS